MNPTIILILSVSVLAGAGIGYLLGRHAAPWLLIFIWAVMAGFIISFSSDPIMDAMGLPDTGFDRLGYVFLAWLFVAPALAGSLIVGIPTLIRRKNREAAGDE